MTTFRMTTRVPSSRRSLLGLLVLLLASLCHAVLAQQPKLRALAGGEEIIAEKVQESLHVAHDSSRGEESSDKKGLNIILSNDDGFESTLTQTLFKALQAAGHNVVLSAPYDHMSATSGVLDWFHTYHNTHNPSPKGSVKAGSPGVGPTNIMDQQYYVNGAVTSAILYGIDILAPQYFQGPPDLVITGPNWGHNMGLLSIHSSTVMGAVTAMNKGIPSIATSADESERNPQLVCDILVKLVNSLWKEQSTNGKLAIPPQYGLNVNVGQTVPNSSVDDYHFQKSKVGLAASLGLVFYQDLAECPFAHHKDDHAPGVCYAEPYYKGSGYPIDDSPDSEYHVFMNDPYAVSVSVIQANFQAPEAVEKQVYGNLGNIIL